MYGSCTDKEMKSPPPKKKEEDCFMSCTLCSF